MNEAPLPPKHDPYVSLRIKDFRLFVTARFFLTVATQMPWISFLWHNLIGAVAVVVVGMAISYMQQPNAAVVRT